jgi:hypothetical protein
MSQIPGATVAKENKKLEKTPSDMNINDNMSEVPEIKNDEEHIQTKITPIPDSDVAN